MNGSTNRSTEPKLTFSQLMNFQRQQPQLIQSQVQIPTQQVQRVEDQAANEAVVTNFDTAALLPTLSVQLPVLNVTTSHQTPSSIQPPNTLAAEVVTPAPVTVQPTLLQPVSTTTTQATTNQNQVLLHPPLVPINPRIQCPSVIYFPTCPLGRSNQ